MRCYFTCCGNEDLAPAAEQVAVSNIFPPQKLPSHPDSERWSCDKRCPAGSVDSSATTRVPSGRPSEVPPHGGSEGERTLQVTFSRLGQLGLVLEEKTAGLVCSMVMDGGSVSVHNKVAPADEHICVHDFFVAVNGETVRERMLAVLKEGPPELTVTLIRPVVFVTRVKKGPPVLGAKIAFQRMGRSIDISKVSDTGALAKHNRQAPAGEVIQAGDFIVRANGVSGTSDELLQAVAGKEELELTVVRAPNPLLAK